MSDPAMFRALALRDAGAGGSPGQLAFAGHLGKTRDLPDPGGETGAKGWPRAQWRRAIRAFGASSLDVGIRHSRPALVLEPDIPVRHREKLIVNAGIMLSRSLRPERAEEDSRDAAKEKGQ